MCLTMNLNEYLSCCCVLESIRFKCRCDVSKSDSVASKSKKYLRAVERLLKFFRSFNLGYKFYFSRSNGFSEIRRFTACFDWERDFSALPPVLLRLMCDYSLKDGRRC